jgi:hypothetical protein
MPGTHPPERRKFELHGELGGQLGGQNTPKNRYILGDIIRFLMPKMALFSTFWGTYYA